MTKHLTDSLNLLQLKHQAKDFLKLLEAGDPDAIARFERQRDAPRPEYRLSDAQLTIAREYGFSSWPRLKAHIEEIQRIQQRVAQLRQAFASGDAAGRERLLAGVHTRERFRHYKPGSQTLSEEDARLVVANEEGYAFWSKYESYLHLDEAVKAVIAAVRQGDLVGVQTALRRDPKSANPRWVSGERPDPIPNDSIPLFCLSEGVFNGTNRKGNDYELAKALIAAGADVEAEGGIPLTAAVSYNARGATRALLEAGAAVDGLNGRGAPMAYALYLGFTGLSELLASYGSKLDLRFASGLGRLDLMETFFREDGTLAPGAGALSDPYEDKFRCERTDTTILSQALLFACLNNRLAVADYLLKKGAEPNVFVPGMPLKMTVLHFLVEISAGAAEEAALIEQRRLPAMQFLLSRGADTTIKDPQYKSDALGWAEYQGRSHMIELLRRHSGVH